MQSTETIIQKTFQVTNELNNNSVTVQIKTCYLTDSRQIDIGQAIGVICKTDVDMMNSHVFYLDIVRKMYIHIGLYPFTKITTLRNELFISDEAIKLKYRKIIPQKAADKVTPQLKKKVKERTIGEAVAAVQQWRKLYDLPDINGNRIYNLQTAALAIGYSKKTLDDYAYHIRIAREEGFNLQKQSYSKTGKLREFVREVLRRRRRPEVEVENIQKYFASSQESEEEEKKRR